MERLIIEQDVTKFRARVEPFLLVREAENNLLFGILHAIAGGRYAEPLLSLLEDGTGGIAAVAIRTPPHNLVLSSTTVEAARVLADELADRDVSLPGVNGPTKQARAFAERWTERTAVTATRAMAQGIYALHEVRPPAGIEGRPRVASHDDIDLLGEWITAFAREALDEDDPNAGNARERAAWYLDSDDARVLLWENDGVPVSFAGASGPTPNGVRVGPVYTPPSRRGRGYASACVAELSARLLAEGRSFCFLYTDLANPTSNAIYQRIGYEPVCDADVYRFT